MTAQTVEAVEGERTDSVIPLADARISVSQYLEMELRSEVRHEYVDGVVIAMAGGSPTHDRIAGNAYLKLESAFGTRPCGAFTGNLRVRVSETQYRYPDVSALCGAVRFTDENPQALLNPMVIMEVLSNTTAGADRGDKFGEYRQVDSLTDYILISQERVEVTHFSRQSPTQWVVTIHSDLSDIIGLGSLGVSVTLNELYRKTGIGTDAVPIQETVTLEVPSA